MPTTMKATRHVNVFHRSDGICIHDKSWDDESASTHTHNLDPPDSISIPPPTLWPLIQVFIQFSREVQGGSVKRLVFRNPEEYAPTVKSFQSAPHQTNTDQKPPIVVHVAHDDLFVVAVTEMLSTGSHVIDFANEEGENAPVLTIAEFCESCLDFLNKEQTAFLAALANQDFTNGRTMAGGPRQRNRNDEEVTMRATASNFRLAGGMSSSSGSRTTSSQSDMTASYEDDRVEPVPQTAAHDPVVSINEARLSEYISKTQTLLRM